MMNDNTSKNKLLMLDFHFPSFSFHQTKVQGKVNLKTDFRINFGRNKENPSLIRVEIDTDVHDVDNLFHLNLSAVALFRYESYTSDLDRDEEYLKERTLSIMLPFIRSEISLLTTQPGITPVLLQPIDVQSLITHMKKS